MRSGKQFIRSRYLEKGQEEFYKVFEDFIEQTEKKTGNPYYQFGYETFGIILYGFCKWMIRDLKKRNIRKVVFFSRDGYIMKKAFELMPEAKEFDVSYIYVSRRSLRVPQLWVNQEDRLRAMFPTKYISIGDLLTSVGLDPALYKQAAEREKLSLDTVIKDQDIEKDPRVKHFLEILWPDILENAHCEYDILKKYLKQFSFEERTAVVDIGWRGSMQYFLSKLLPEAGIDTKMTGYYITLSSSMIRGLDMHGYLTDVDAEGDGCDLLRGYVGLIEAMFMKDEGSVEKYREDNGKVVPVLYESEDEKSDDMISEMKKVSQIQRGALDCVTNLCRLKTLEKVSFSSEAAFTYLSNVGNHPAWKDIRLFGWFPFYNNGTVSRLADARPLFYYLIHPRKAKNDLYISRWRVGFLKKMCMLPLPYYRMFRILMKLTM